MTLARARPAGRFVVRGEFTAREWPSRLRDRANRFKLGFQITRLFDSNSRSLHKERNRLGYSLGFLFFYCLPVEKCVSGLRHLRQIMLDAIQAMRRHAFHLRMNLGA